MTNEKMMKDMALSEEGLTSVDGGVSGISADDLVMRDGQDKYKVENLPTGGRTFTIKSAIATGETIGKVAETDASKKTGKKTGKRLPKIIFRDKGTSV